jgi:hypothetical protein
MAVNPVIFVFFGVFLVICIIYGWYAGSKASAFFVRRGRGTGTNSDFPFSKAIKNQERTLNMVLDLLPEVKVNG